MSLVALDGTPLVMIGAPFRLGSGNAFPSGGTTVMDAANEATIMFGHIVTDDGASHTIDTTGSSALAWQTQSVTFANAGTTVKVGLATLDAGNGPPARATNVADVITASVSKSLTGGGGLITANTWHSHVPDTGTMAVANGDYIAFFVQMTARAGADTVTALCGNVPDTLPRPGVTQFTGAAYNGAAQTPNALITFSDGHVGWFYGGAVFTTASTTQTWNSGSATKEYGNLFQMPFPCKIYGLYAAHNVAGDTDFILYSDPLGTPVAEKTVSADLNQKGAQAIVYSMYLFSSPYTTTAGQNVAAIMKPTSVTNGSSVYKTYNAAANQITEMCGTNGYAVNRASGAFAAQNSNKDRFGIGLLVGAFDAGGGASVVQYRANMSGNV